MGDKKGRKDKTKGRRQADAKQAKTAQQRQNKQQPPATGLGLGHSPAVARGRSSSDRRSESR